MTTSTGLAPEAVSNEMRDQINTELYTIERNEDVRIIFASESGSRAWGFPSPDSDYDVRFVYARPLDWYLSVSRGRDVIERPLDDVLDINGWDIQKAMGLLLKPNPVLLEWLSSPVRYRWAPQNCSRLITFSRKTAFGTACLNHYLHLAERQWRVYLEGKEMVNLKKYFYVVRPAMAIRWIRMNPTDVPPMNFQALCDGVELQAALTDELNDLLRQKNLAKELGEAPRIDIVDCFITEELTWAREAVKTTKPLRPAIAMEADDIFRSIIKAEGAYD